MDARQIADLREPHAQPLQGRARGTDREKCTWGKISAEQSLERHSASQNARVCRSIVPEKVQLFQESDQSSIEKLERNETGKISRTRDLAISGQ
jgi:hypothetical protein